MSFFFAKRKMDKTTKIIVTAGPTREAIDPVRFISNTSTGHMGYAIASSASGRGCQTLLISGPVSIGAPAGIDLISVTTAREMEQAVKDNVGKYDCLIMTAAVCDFRPEQESEQKIKKTQGLTLKLTETPDILMSVIEEKHIKKIGFALETENAIENAKGKMAKKGLDAIVLNMKKEGKDPFGPGKKDFIVLKKDGTSKEFIEIDKKDMAEVIVDEALEIIQ